MGSRQKFLYGLTILMSKTFARFRLQILVRVSLGRKNPLKASKLFKSDQNVEVS